MHFTKKSILKLQRLDFFFIIFIFTALLSSDLFCMFHLSDLLDIRLPDNSIAAAFSSCGTAFRRHCLPAPIHYNALILRPFFCAYCDALKSVSLSPSFREPLKFLVVTRSRIVNPAWLIDASMRHLYFPVVPTLLFPIPSAIEMREIWVKSSLIMRKSISQHLKMSNEGVRIR